MARAAASGPRRCWCGVSAPINPAALLHLIPQDLGRISRNRGLVPPAARVAPRVGAASRPALLLLGLGHGRAPASPPSGSRRRRRGRRRVERGGVARSVLGWLQTAGRGLAAGRGVEVPGVAWKRPGVASKRPGWPETSGRGVEAAGRVASAARRRVKSTRSGIKSTRRRINRPQRVEPTRRAKAPGSRIKSPRNASNRPGVASNRPGSNRPGVASNRPGVRGVSPPSPTWPASSKRRFLPCRHHLSRSSSINRPAPVHHIGPMASLTPSWRASANGSWRSGSAPRRSSFRLVGRLRSAMGMFAGFRSLQP